MIETCIPITHDFNQESRNFKRCFGGSSSPEARIEITTGRWFKRQEMVGWGEGSEAAAAKAAKNRYME